MTALITFFTSPIGRWLAGGIIVLMLAGAIYAKGYSNGKAVVQGRWDRAVEAAIERGSKARSDAERSVGSNGNAVGVPNDRFDRDRGTM